MISTVSPSLKSREIAGPTLEDVFRLHDVEGGQSDSSSGLGGPSACLQYLWAQSPGQKMNDAAKVPIGMKSSEASTRTIHGGTGFS